jgi:hypothetical protein
MRLTITCPDNCAAEYVERVADLIAQGDIEGADGAGHYWEINSWDPPDMAELARQQGDAGRDH